jgi:nitroreductase
MSNSRYKERHSEKKSNELLIGRRVFLKEISLLSFAAVTSSTLLQACSSAVSTSPTAGPVATPPVQQSQSSISVTSMSVVDALRNRKSTNSFQLQPLPKQKLLELLWAAWGINRPDSGKRTAPSAVNAQEIDIYVLLAEGAYVYDAKGNQLSPVMPQDLRPKSAGQAFMKDAPVHLIFVADYAKYRNIPQSQKELYSACHTGFIGQNVYLFCATQGLGAHFYASVDRSSLKDSLKLREDQAIIYGQAVGYPKE